MRRKRACEVCGQTQGTVSNVDAGTRIIALCEAHGARAAVAGAASTEALRQMFLEVNGRRALLSRRAEDERRLFPPRPEGRRMRRGRRTSDRARGG